MSTQVGPEYPTTGSQEGGGEVWFSPNNIISDNGQVALADASGGDTKYLVATGFDFSSVPDSANIVGILIELEGQWVNFI